MPDIEAGIDASRAEAGARSFINALDRMNKQAGRTARSTQKIQKSSDGLARSFRTLGRVAAGLGVALGFREVIQFADSMTQLNNRLKLVTKSDEELISVQAELIRQSKQAFVSLDAQAEVFQRVAVGAGALGLSTREALQATEAISLAVRLSGVAAETARNALVQLGQGFAAGTLRGEELNSVIENTPALADAIAKSLGVTRGALKSMGEEGKLVASKIIPGLIDQIDELKARTALLDPTVDEAFTNLKTSLTVAIGDLNEVTGFATGFGRAINSVAKAVEENLVPSLLELSIQLGIVLDVGNEVARGLNAGADLISDAFGSAEVSVEGFGGTFLDILTNAIPNAIAVVKLTVTELVSLFRQAKLATTSLFVAAEQAILSFRLAAAQERGNEREIAILRGEFDALSSLRKQAAIDIQTEKDAFIQRTQAILDGLNDERAARATLRLEAQKARDARAQALKDIDERTKTRAGGLEGDAPSEANKLSKDVLKLIAQTRTPFEEFQEDFKELQDAIAEGLPLENVRTGVENLINELAASNAPLSDFSEALAAAVASGIDEGDIEFLGDLGLELENVQGQLDDFRDVFGDVPIEDFFAAIEEGRDIVEDTLTPLEEYEAALAKVNKSLEAGIISEDIFNRKVKQLKEDLSGASDVLEEFAIQAARNTQDAFAEFLFDPFDSNLKGLVSNFADTLRKIASEALANQILKSLFQGAAGGTGAFATIAGFFASGKAGGGPVAAGVPVPVGERGPEVFVPQQSGTVFNQEQMAAMAPIINNIVQLDMKSAVADGLSSPQGSRALINAVQINKKAIAASLR